MITLFQLLALFTLSDKSYREIVVLNISRDYGFALRYLGYQPWWHAAQKAPDESRGADETSRSSPVVASLLFPQNMTGSTPPVDNPMITHWSLILRDYPPVLQFCQRHKRRFPVERTEPRACKCSSWDWYTWFAGILQTSACLHAACQNLPAETAWNIH